jgi:multimeric flavodoxin WrbA
VSEVVHGLFTQQTSHAACFHEPQKKEEREMKVLAINGSPRKEGNTSRLLKLVCSELEREGIDTELFQLGKKKIRGCIACYKCFENRDRRCAVDNDVLNGCLEKMIEADGILLGSPTYFSDVTAEMKALIDRAGLVAIANDHLFKRKAGAAVVAVRRAGSIHVFDSINHLFFISQMIVPGSSYWNMGIGLEEGEVEQDEEGVRTMKTLGENMAWLLKRTAGG